MGVMLDLNNYLADTRPEDIQFFDKVAKKLKSREETTNSTVPVTQIFAKPMPINRGYNYSYGYVSTSSVHSTDLIFSVNGSNTIRMSQLPELNMVMSCGIQRIGGAFGSEPNYSVPLYFTLFASNDTITLDPLLIYPLGNINWVLIGTSYIWTTTNPSRNFNLKNYILNRPIALNGRPDFSNNNSTNSNYQITKNQYENLVNNLTTSLYANICYDSASMTTNQTNHFDSIWNTGGFAMSLTLNFIMTGSLASFTPTITN